MTDIEIFELWGACNIDPLVLAFGHAIAEEAARQEREACAIMCEVHAASVINDGKQPAWAIAHECAKAVRSRSSTTGENGG